MEALHLSARRINLGFLDFDLADLIEIIGLNEMSPFWQIRVEEATLKTDAPIEIHRLMESAQNSCGLNLSQLEIVTLSKHILQTIDAQFLGLAEPISGKFPNIWDPYEDFEFIMEAVDSSYWLFWCKKKELMRKVQGSFVQYTLEIIPEED